VSLVIVGASNEPDLEEALGVFIDGGFTLARDLVGWEEKDGVLALRGDGAAMLKEADAQGIRYVLIHLGADDGAPGGSHERAHHRVDVERLRELAHQLRLRDKLLVTCLAFAFKKGIPEGAAWVVDVRMLDNPYWVEELRPLDGRDPRVREFVVSQQAAKDLLDNMERTLRAAVPHYRERGRSELVVAFGCTGGRHRSVVMAHEMSMRLQKMDDVDVEFRTRDLTPRE
jgi:rhodanese/phosphatase family RapZ-like protein